MLLHPQCPVTTVFQNLEKSLFFCRFHSYPKNTSFLIPAFQILPWTVWALASLEQPQGPCGFQQWHWSLPHMHADIDYIRLKLHSRGNKRNQTCSCFSQECKRMGRYWPDQAGNSGTWGYLVSTAALLVCWANYCFTWRIRPINPMFLWVFSSSFHTCIDCLRYQADAFIGIKSTITPRFASWSKEYISFPATGMESTLSLLHMGHRSIPLPSR